MIATYLKKRNIAVIIYGLGMGVLIARRILVDVDELPWYFELVAWIAVGGLLSACWFYLKAKKRSGAWLLLLPLNLVAFIVYYYLEDRSSGPDPVKCLACGGANFPGDELCRYCKTRLPVADERQLKI